MLLEHIPLLPYLKHSVQEQIFFHKLDLSSKEGWKEEIDSICNVGLIIGTPKETILVFLSPLQFLVVVLEWI